MLHIPVLRGGRPYTSIEKVEVRDHATGDVIALLSQANSGLIARDLADPDPARGPLRAVPAADLVAITRAAAERFLHGELPLGAATQRPEDYVRAISRTTGLPEVLARRNMLKVHSVMASIDQVLGGLTRGLDLSILDSGYGTQDGRMLCYLPETRWLGAVLPSNSPGVHSLWVPAIALKTCLALKPGREEPWTPYRVIQSFIAAGAPPAAFGFYPTSHEGAGEILRRAGRSLLFGDASTARAWEKDRRIQVHGPGYSKIVIAPDAVERWEDHLDVLVSSISENGGRSCINASGIWTTARGREIADALARRLAPVEPKPPADPEASLAAFVNPRFAEMMNAVIEEGLRTPGAEDATAVERRRLGLPEERLVRRHGSTYLLPTVIRCDDPEHPLAGKEFLFPFAAVVEAPLERILDRMGPTLVCTCITKDPAVERALLASGKVDRLNLGAIPTTRIGWDQPHEGNLFQHLYRQRAFQHVA